MNTIRHLALAARRPVRQPLFIPLRCQRPFSFTPRVQATEQDNTFLNNFKDTSVFRQIANNPEALMALRDFSALMKEKGIDASSGPPSTMQMLRLAGSSDFRKAAQKVVDELKNAGVDLTSQVS
ncbi:hypothetical protein PAXRUDRAFT_827320 [Paxillus rubicundulus Ve08.2h10]|uniref:Uncharacterized protein n=1 Tax=Paxillus rubicundulus Ve08.2h10 TaxID=930991 RepID=A0A0D0E2Y4_9AGAM|nr:hypothetical protein PAXRUDRAFT_827320 [Paxillus rubicundulus Ve08.2h10]